MDHQKEAIETIDMNLAVNAGAGTGKTKVLTERYVHILENGDLEEGWEIESLVAITFTKKASTEMKERIEKEIAKHLYKGSQWNRLYRDFTKAYIMTIHSFCGKLLKENPVEAEIDPDFQVLEEYVADRMLKESAEIILDNALKDDQGLEALFSLGKRDIESISRELIDLYKKIRTLGISVEKAMEITLSHLDGMKMEEDVLKEIRELLRFLREKITRGKLADVVKEKTVEGFIKGEHSDHDIKDILVMVSQNMGSSKKEPEAQAKLKDLVDLSMAVFEKDKVNLYRTILEIVEDIHLEYSRRKNSQGVLDYEDLQIKAFNLLESEDILRKYQSRFKYIMIDEFQDTNQLQKNIFYRLASVNEKLDRNNLFVVGDPKQSIYAFRGADIQVFYDVMDDIRASGNGKIITLTENYRTVSTVLDLVDKIFRGLMGDRYDSLNPNKDVDEPLDVEVIYDEEFQGNTRETQEFEAEQVARRIRYMVDNESLNHGQGIKYKDIALLFRAMTRSNIYEEALRRYGIPHNSTGGVSFYERDEILDIMNALKAISNHKDTISMVGFFRGGFVGLSDEAIYHILRKCQQEGCTIMDAVNGLANDKENMLDSSDHATMVPTMDLYKRLLHLKNHTSIYSILRLLVDETGFQKSQLLQYQGLMKSDNVDSFFRIVKDYEASEGGTLEDFIDYLTTRREDSDRDGISTMDNGDSVSLMSIHKSKGLQFPVVIIPEMGRKGNNDTSTFQFDKDKGLGIKHDESSYYNLIFRDTRQNLEEEVQRLIYVAMTRAEERLVLGYQGKKNGFKALVDEYLDQTKLKVISNIPVFPEETHMIKTLDTQGSKEDIANYPLVEFKQEPVNGRETYSISQYSRFLRCPREYFLTYKARLKIGEENEMEEIQEGFLDGASKGTLVHEFCRSYKKEDSYWRLIEDIADMQGVSLNDNTRLQLKPLLDNFVGYSEKEAGVQVEMEKEFYITLEDFVLTGFIDRLENLNGALRIVDIKTNKIFNKNKLIDGYRPQLIFYRWAVKKITGKENVSAAILFLEDGSLEEVEISKMDEEYLVSDMSRVFSFIETHHDLEDYAIGKENCHNCGFRQFCITKEA